MKLISLLFLFVFMLESVLVFLSSQSKTLVGIRTLFCDDLFSRLGYTG